MNKERRKAIEKLVGRLNELRNDIESIQQEEQDAFDNMSESFQEGERGEAMQEGLDQLESAVNGVDESIEALENI